MSYCSYLALLIVLYLSAQYQMNLLLLLDLDFYGVYIDLELSESEVPGREEAPGGLKICLFSLIQSASLARDL